MSDNVLKLPSQDQLNRLLSYDPTTGELEWKVRTPDLWPDTSCGAEKLCANWNARYAGRPAVNSLTNGGYRIGDVLGVRYKRHRVIWKMMTGEEPETIDHINGIPGDDRWENLRGVSRGENQKNMKRRSDNTTGVTGVSWDRANKKWRANINKNGSVTNLGRFEMREEAIAARRQAERDLGYHKNHGNRGA